MTGWQGHGSVDISDILIQNISGDDVGMPLHLLAFEATVKRIIISNFHTNCKGRALIKGKPGWISDLVLRNVDFHDQLFIPPHSSEQVRQTRSNAILEFHGTERTVLDNVKIYALDNYFEDRREIISAEHSTFSKCNVTWIQNNTETSLSSDFHIPR